MSYNSPNVLPLERRLRQSGRRNAALEGLSILERKDAAAEELIRRHFEMDPAIVRVYRIRNDKEDDPKEPIKLLEISLDAVPSDVLDLFDFAPSGDLPFFRRIGMLTPDDFEDIREACGFPQDWDIDRAEPFERSGE